jgi:hypothetical protein
MEHTVLPTADFSGGSKAVKVRADKQARHVNIR